MNDRIFQDAKKFAGQFAGFLQAAEAWADVQSIDRAHDEAQNRLYAKHKEEAELDARLAARHQEMVEKVEAELAQKRAETDAYDAMHQKMARDVMDTAHMASEGLVNAAKEQAEDIIKNARAQRESDEARFERARKLHEDLEAQIKQKQEDLHSLNLQVNEASDRHVTITRQLADLRASLR